MRWWQEGALAATAGATLMLGVGEVQDSFDFSHKNQELSNCQVDLALEQTLIGTCSKRVIELAVQDDELGKSVYRSPELDSFDGLEFSGRLALVIDGDYKNILIDKLEAEKVDMTEIRYFYSAFGALYGFFGVLIWRSFERYSPDHDPPGDREPLPDVELYDQGEEVTGDVIELFDTREAS